MEHLPSSTFCRLPFSHLYIDERANLYPCCMSVTRESQLKDEFGNELKGNDPLLFEKIEHSPELLKIRSNFLNNIRPECCQSCFKFEDNHAVSYRNLVNKDFDNLDFNSLILKPKLWSIDLRLGNKCNLKCQMCFPQNSFLLEKDYQEVFASNLTNSDKIDLLWSNDFEVFKRIFSNINSECRINFAGGEPLLSNEGFSFISKLVETQMSSQIILTYNTNLNILPEKYIEVWRSFKAVHLVVSIDATEELAEYIRYPIKWENFNKNLKKLIHLAQENSGLSVEFHSVVQIYNILDLDKLVRFTTQFELKKFSHRFDFVIGAENCFSIRDLPYDLKKMAQNKLQDFLNSEPFLNQKNYKLLKSNLELILVELSVPSRNFFRRSMLKTYLFDQLRGNDFFKLKPEFLPYRPPKYSILIHKNLLKIKKIWRLLVPQQLRVVVGRFVFNKWQRTY